MKLSDWVKKHDLKTNQAARILHISPAQLSVLLKEQTVPGLAMAYRIEVFSNREVTMYDLLKDDIIKMYKAEKTYEDMKKEAMEKTQTAA